MKVDFFIIGSPKCGTSAIAKYLAEHPQICFSVPKEPRFFVQSDYALECGDRSDEAYWHKYFPHCDPEMHQTAGEGTPMYLYYDESVPMILDYNPNAKFIVMLRNPVDMVVSLHKNLLRGFSENVLSLEKAWNLQSERKTGNCLPPNPQIRFDLQYKAICSLGSQVNRLLERVERERVKIFLLDDLKADAGRVYTELCSFLEVENDGRAVFEQVNVGREWESNVLRSLHASAYRIKCAIFGTRPLPFNIDQTIRRYTTRRTSGASTVSSEFMEFLKREFRDDVELLASAIDRDLSQWL